MVQLWWHRVSSCVSCPFCPLLVSPVYSGNQGASGGRKVQRPHLHLDRHPRGPEGHSRPPPVTWREGQTPAGQGERHTHHIQLISSLLSAEVFTSETRPKGAEDSPRPDSPNPWCDVLFTPAPSARNLHRWSLDYQHALIKWQSVTFDLKLSDYSRNM